MTAPRSIKRVLAIHAHPDDIEFQCAGTLALLKKQGCEITIATMTPGDCGSAEHSAEEISEIRRGEAKAAAELLGAECLCLEFRDLSIVVDNDGRRRVTEVIRQVRPDLVFTAPPVDYMSDHEMTSRLVRDACFNASCPNYVTRQWDPASPTDQIPYLYYVDPVEGVDWFRNPIEPDCLIDISSTYEMKQQMLACHASQREWLRKQHGMDEYLDMCRRASAKRGTEAGVEYAEGFRQHTGHPYPSDPGLTRMLN